MTKALNAAVWAFAVACFGLLALVGIGPRTGRYATLTVLSGSMRPGIPPGAVIVETPEPASSLRVGQVVTYPIPVDDHHVLTHRVVEVVSGGDHPIFQTKGDANDAADPWQAQTGGTVWRVRAVVPGLGYAIGGLRNRALRVVGVVVPVVLAVRWVIGIWRNDDDPDDVGVAVVSAP
jgi:signal peptidase I